MTTTDPASILQRLDADQRRELWASLALMHTPGIGLRRIRRLLSVFSSAFEAVSHPEKWRECCGIADEQRDLLMSGVWRKAAEAEWSSLKHSGCGVLLWTDPLYPPCLRELPDAPVRLYTLGSVELLRNPCVAIVGSRRCSARAGEMTSLLAHELSSSGITIVSGLALGIDYYAHRGALTGIGSTIAVLGAGLNILYPRQNEALRRSIEENGLILSEYAPDTLPIPQHFPVRNRIISGLSLGVAVMEAALKSGSLVTARLALDQNRAIYAAVGDPDDEGTAGNRALISQGALPLESAADILRDLQPQLSAFLKRTAGQETEDDMLLPPELHLSASLREEVKKPHRQKKPDDQVLLELEKAETAAEKIGIFLRACGPASADDICLHLRMNAVEVGMSLTMMQMSDTIRLLFDNRYEWIEQ
ncbi:MAG: DNA-processing protein DprA [Desulfovibrionaceae bacterium]|nr:DNA-processing protein DprA [Desulfovibrionaceae bacterium]